MIKSLEYEFSNGYYFLLLLQQKGLLQDEEFEKAGNATDPELIKSNYAILVPALHRLGMTFSKRDVAKVSRMEGARLSCYCY